MRRGLRHVSTESVPPGFGRPPLVTRPAIFPWLLSQPHPHQITSNSNHKMHKDTIEKRLLCRNASASRMRSEGCSTDVTQTRRYIPKQRSRATKGHPRLRHLHLSLCSRPTSSPRTHSGTTPLCNRPCGTGLDDLDSP